MAQEGFEHLDGGEEGQGSGLYDHKDFFLPSRSVMQCDLASEKAVIYGGEFVRVSTLDPEFIGSNSSSDSS